MNSIVRLGMSISLEVGVNRTFFCRKSGLLLRSRYFPDRSGM